MKYTIRIRMGISVISLDHTQALFHALYARIAHEKGPGYEANQSSALAAAYSEYSTCHRASKHMRIRILICENGTNMRKI